jgi:hypothetical protein
MSARDEVERLKKEFMSLNSEEERLVFDEKFKSVLASKNEDEKKDFGAAFIEAAKSDTERIGRFIDEVTVRMKLEDVLDVISMTYVAKTYFNKGRAWFSQKLNGNLKNGKVSSFTEEELKVLAGALDDIGQKLQNTARSIA